ncbi:extracellular solute-binding protein [Actinopolymorpha sp. B9G3]|uniref:ABC transporter substrate-binding protein n=1 Tax=Actinopolymorpha sp. B9G3 TaxID=3158970 RepID=UPI0032D9A395
MRLRSAAALTAAGLVAALLAACGGDGGSTGDGSDGGDVKTVVVWDRAGAEASARQAFFKKWNAKEGRELGIKVRFEPQATEKYEEIVRLGFQTERSPDIFHAPSAQMGGFVAAGWVQPLDGLVNDKLLEDADPYLQDTSELVWGGRPYAIPTTTFTVRLAINRELFEKAGLDPDDPPTTFSEVEEAARAITKAGGGDAYGVGLPMGWVGFQGWTLDLPILSAYGDLAQNGLFNKSTGKFESEKYASSVEHFRTLIKDKTVYPGAETMDYDVFLSSFAEGKVGMVLTSGSIVGGLQQLDSKVDLGTGPIPVPDGTTPVRSPMNAGFPVAISSRTEEPEAAATVFGVLVGPEMQETLAKNGIPPLSEEAWDSPVAKENASLQLFRPTDNDQQWPKNPGSVLSLEGKDTATTVIGLILEPDTDVDAGLAELATRYQKAWETGVENGEIEPKEFGR